MSPHGALRRCALETLPRPTSRYVRCTRTAVIARVAFGAHGRLLMAEPGSPASSMWSLIEASTKPPSPSSPGGSTTHAVPSTPTDARSGRHLVLRPFRLESQSSRRRPSSRRLRAQRRPAGLRTRYSVLGMTSRRCCRAHRAENGHRLSLADADWPTASDGERPLGGRGSVAVTGQEPT